MQLYNILDRNSCALDIPEKTKEAVLGRMGQIASESRFAGGVAADRFYEELSGRERQGSTGFGNEVAIPHARIRGMTEFLLFIVTSHKGVEFDAVDKKKVHVFFVLFGPDDKPAEHLKILAAVSRMLASTNVKRDVLEARSSTGVYEVFLRHARSAEGEAGRPRAVKALFVILYEEEFLHGILELFIQEGIEGATIMDSSGMGEYVSNVPLFASFVGSMNKRKNRSRTLIAMIPEERVDEIVRGIEEITGDLDKKEGAMVFALDVGFYKGTMKMM